MALVPGGHGIGRGLRTHIRSSGTGGACGSRVAARGGSGGGTLPRKELHEAAEQLTANQAGPIAVGEPTIEQTVDKALTRGAKVVKRTVEATTDEITSELQEALKS